MEVASVCPLRVARLVWRAPRGALTLTVVCKGTFALVSGEAHLLEEQEPPNEDDNHWNDDPSRSLYAASDLVPFKARADVLLVGHAFAPNGLPVRKLTARLRAAGVDKAIEIASDAPFARMPLRYERASGFRVVGAPPIEGGSPPGFGPIAPSWRPRRQRLAPDAAAWLAGGIDKAPMPDDLDPAFFNVAPRDQQIETIEADAEIRLEHLDAQHAELVTRLPGVFPRASIEGHGAGIALRCDTLWIDTDRRVATLTWRGNLEIDGTPPGSRVVVSMETLPPLSKRGPLPSLHGRSIAPPATEPPPSSSSAPPAGDRSSSAELTSPSIRAMAASASAIVVPAHATIPPISPAGPPPAEIARREPMPSHDDIEMEEASDEDDTSPPSSAAEAPMSSRPTRPSLEAMSGVGPPTVVPPAPRLPSAPSANAMPALNAMPAPANAMPSPANAASLPAATTTHVGLFAVSLPTSASPSPSAMPSPPASPSPSAAASFNAALTNASAASAALSRNARPRHIELLWLDPERSAAVRVHFKLKDAINDRKAIAILMAGPQAATPSALRTALNAAYADDGTFTPPLVLLSGELELLFDGLDLLRALITSALPFAPGNRKLREAVDALEELLRTPGIDGSYATVVGRAIIARLKDELAQANRSLPDDYLDDSATRLVLERRRYQRRTVLGEPWLRAQLHLRDKVTVPTYLPEALAPRLPMFQRLDVALIAEVHAAQDHYETHPHALRAVALGRSLARP